MFLNTTIFSKYNLNLLLIKEFTPIIDNLTPNTAWDHYKYNKLLQIHYCIPITTWVLWDFMFGPLKIKHCTLKLHVWSTLNTTLYFKYKLGTLQLHVWSTPKTTVYSKCNLSTLRLQRRSTPNTTLFLKYNLGTLQIYVRSTLNTTIYSEYSLSTLWLQGQSIPNTKLSFKYNFV